MRGHHRGVVARHQEAALATRTLRDDQRAAFEHAVSVGGLKLIEGRAGTGKSYTLAAVREAHEAGRATAWSAWRRPTPWRRT